MAMTCGNAFFRKAELIIDWRNYSRQNNGILSRNTDFWLNMQVLKLLVRVAFICNICFLLACLILWLPNPPEGQVVSTVIVMGYGMGLPVNAIVFGWALVLAAAEKWRTAALPVWLLIVNFIVFCFQILSR